MSNRATILRAAAVVLSERGQGVDVREIARAAGVGMGTLYRHFPSKEALIETLLRESYAQWIDEALCASSSQASAWDALAGFITDSLKLQARDRAVLESLAEWTTEAEGHNLCLSTLRPLLEDLVSAAHAEGALRPGVRADDVLGVITALGRLVQLRMAEENVTRCLDIALTGLRHGGALR